MVQSVAGENRFSFCTSFVLEVGVRWVFNAEHMSDFQQIMVEPVREL